MTTLDLSMCYQELGFTEPPFRLTPDTDFFFPGSHHMEALNHLQFGIASGGFTMLTGEVGLGKTLLCRHLLRHPPVGVRFAYLLNPDQSYGDLLTSIYEDLTGTIPEDRSLGALQRELPKLLLRLAEGRRTSSGSGGRSPPVKRQSLGRAPSVVKFGYRERQAHVSFIGRTTRT